MTSIRFKLMALLLVTALVPMLAVMWFDQHATRGVGEEMAARARGAVEERALEQLQAAVATTAAMVRERRAVLEATVELQAQAVAAALAEGPGAAAQPPMPAAAQADATAGLDYGRVAVAPAGTGAVARSEAARLAGLAAMFGRLRASHARNVLWQRAALVDGTNAVYPAAAAPPAAGEPDWARRAIAAGRTVWNPPVTDPLLGRPAMAVSTPVRGSAGPVAGAAAIDVAVDALLESAALKPFGPALLLLVTTLEAPDGHRLLQVVAGADDEQLDPGPEGATVTLGVAGRRPGLQRMAWHGREMVWAWGPVDNEGTALLTLTTPLAVSGSAIAAEDEVRGWIAREGSALWLGLVLTLPLVVLLAYLGSRTVTRPLGQLADAARGLARGDFAARVDIRSGDELEMLARLFNSMVPQLHERLRLLDSLALAQEVQRNLLPSEAPSAPGFDIAGMSIYCDETGGDYYDFLGPEDVGEGRVAVAVGDVAGHGVAAALLMTTVRAMLRSASPPPGGLAAAMGEINRRLARDIQGGRFMTLFYAVLVAGDRGIHWVSAGHPPGLLYDPADDSFREVPGLDIPLGVDPDWRYHELSHHGWSAGTVLALGTDGIWETRDPDGRMFGREALQATVRAAAGGSAEDIVAAVATALERFRAGTPQQDDVALVVVKALY